MSYIESHIRSALLLASAAALLASVGCGKKDEAASAPAGEPAASVTSADLFEKPIGQAADPTTVLAVVNGTDITLGDFNKEMDVMMNRMQGRMPPERLAQVRMQMRDQLLDNMITRRVLIDASKGAGITVSEEEYSEAVKELTESLPPGMTLNDMLAQAKTTEEEFRSTLTTELQIRELIKGNVAEKPEVTDEEIDAFYKENQEQFQRPETVSASHILIGVEATDTDEQKAEKRKQAEDIRQKLADGGDFAALAGEFSTCPSKAQGGDLGSFPRGRMVPEFEEAAFTQEIGTVGPIVETQFGYHLIKVTARNEAGLTPLDEVKERLTEYLANQKQQTAIQTFVASLREKASVSFPGGAPQTQAPVAAPAPEAPAADESAPAETPTAN